MRWGRGGTVFVPDKERIEEFESDGVFKGEVKIPGETVRQLAVNPKSGGFYAVFEASEGGPKDDVRALSSSGALEGTCKVKHPGALASDGSGRLFVVGRGEDGAERVFEFEVGCGSGEALGSLAKAEFLQDSVTARFELSGLGTNAAGDLFVTNVSPVSDSFIRSFGPGPVSFEGPPSVPPQIEAQFASSVLGDGATVAALINPHFWSDARYYVQYGTGKCSEGGCEEDRPVSPGTLLSSRASGLALRSAGVFLEGLKPGTTYHYRFVAKSSGGGPVFGRGGGTPEKVGEETVFREVGEESAFTTFPEALAHSSCANEAFRGGAAAWLPDCRAYEMVSPIDKNNGDIKALIDTANYPTALSQSSGSGEKFTYSSYRSFGDPKGAPYTNQYIATRDAAKGWSSEAISAPQGLAANHQVNLENPYKAVSADLCSAWLVVAAEPPLAPGATEGYPDLYRRDACGEEGFEALVGVKPSVEPILFEPELQGTSADGKEAILRVKDKLTPDATSGAFQTYYASGGQLRLLCILPDGAPSTGSCSAGTARDDQFFLGAELNRLASVSNAISEDGSRVYWTASGEGGAAGAGTLYLRENPGAEQSALSGEECTEAEKACTVKVSETQSTKAARFLGASANGERALFEVTEGAKEGKLYEFTVGAGSSEIAGKVMGVAGAGEDLSYLYFVSEEALAGAAKAGRPNLYLSHEGTTTFIATLSDTDVASLAHGEGIPSDAAAEPILHAARASADGRALAFISTASLNGYDNTDAASPLSCGAKEGSKEGICDSEVYLYEAGSSGPVCVSCNPSGAQPQGRAVPGVSGSLATAGSLPMATAQLHIPRALSADGQRLFFNSYDALLPRDTNGTEDVYEWESAASQQACAEKGAELYVEAAGGCLSLISSGESPQDSQFLDASASGNDVFFTTSASLLPQDSGLIDVYDARVDGGFPQPTQSAQCEGEACQSPLVPPVDSTPASLVFSGPGNLAPLFTAPPKPTVKPPLKHCRKGMVRRRGGCVRNRHSAHKRAAKARRAGTTPLHAASRERGAGR